MLSLLVDLKVTVLVLVFTLLTIFGVTNLESIRYTTWEHNVYNFSAEFGRGDRIGIFPGERPVLVIASAYREFVIEEEIGGEQLSSGTFFIGPQAYAFFDRTVIREISESFEGLILTVDIPASYHVLDEGVYFDISSTEPFTIIKLSNNNI